MGPLSDARIGWGLAGSLDEWVIVCHSGGFPLSRIWVAVPERECGMVERLANEQ